MIEPSIRPTDAPAVTPGVRMEIRTVVEDAQARGITHPMAGVVQVYSDDSRIRRLAEHYLAMPVAA